MSVATGVEGSTRRAFVSEVFIIVLGILIAFAVDASYDSLRSNSDRRELLASLHAEFTDNRVEITQVIEGHESVIAAITLVLDSVASFRELGDSAAPAELITAVIAFHTFDPHSGATQAMLNSGQLGLVPDPELRRLVSSWSSIVDNLTEDEGHVWDFRDRLRTEMAEVGFSIVEAEPHVVRSLDVNSEFRNFLFFRRADEVRALLSARAAAVHIDEILSHLGAIR